MSMEDKITCGQKKRARLMSLLDRASMAGALTSRIDHQDAAAVLIALRLLANDEWFCFTGGEEPEGLVIHCEGQEDLEIVGHNARCLVSVKSRSSDLSLVSKEYRRLSNCRNPDLTRTNRCGLILIGSQPSEVAKFADQLKQAQALVAQRDEVESHIVGREFSQRWPRFNDKAVSTFYVMIMSQGLYSEEYSAIAIRLLRTIAPVADYTDERLTYLLTEMTSRFARARLARGSVTLTEIRDLIFGFAIPLGFITFVHAYVRTAYGYVRHPAIQTALKREQQDYRTAVKHVMRRYRKATRANRFLAATIIGPVKCIACNGPLMANLWGWRTEGIACSHCGFTPFASLFYACKCGYPILLASQPPLDFVEMGIVLRDACSEARCEKCGQKPVPERLFTRAFALNIPWPPESVDKRLIEARKGFGWSRTHFRDGKADPLKTLLTEALIDRADRRIPQ